MHTLFDIDFDLSLCARDSGAGASRGWQHALFSCTLPRGLAASEACRPSINYIGEETMTRTRVAKGLVFDGTGQRSISLSEPWSWLLLISYTRYRSNCACTAHGRLNKRVPSPLLVSSDLLTGEVGRGEACSLSMPQVVFPPKGFVIKHICSALT